MFSFLLYTMCNSLSRSAYKMLTNICIQCFMFYKIISERAEENDKFKKAICRCRTLFSERPLPCPFSIILSIVSFFFYCLLLLKCTEMLRQNMFLSGTGPQNFLKSSERHTLSHSFWRNWADIFFSKHLKN